jgi:hypothetical protein
VNRTRRASTRICAGIWTALLALTLTAVPLSASAAPGVDRGRGAEHRSDRATEALGAAKDLFRGIARSQRDVAPRGKVRRQAVSVDAGEHATLVLRDLAANLENLDAADRRVARRILARPTDGFDEGWAGVKYDGAPVADTCTLPDQAQHRVCINWVSDPTNVNAPSTVGGVDAQGVPAWVRTNQRVFDQVWQRIVVELGYRHPFGDAKTANPGNDGRTDVYLADLGTSVYGYCVPDAVEGRRALSYPAYCVVDNDFAGFAGTPLGNLEVTAAHEFFHAVQFAYNIFADTWLMEGTAAWMEDEVFDDINDNLQYLSRSALRYPYAPLDFLAPDSSSDPNGYAWRYGSWIWWRFLSEYFGTRHAQDPSVVRQVWERLGRGQSSLQALRGVLRSRGTSFPDVFADFGAVNRTPKAWYAEGASYARYAARPAGQFRLTKARRSTGWMVTKLPHLSSQHVLVRPGVGLRGRWRLRVDLNLPARFRGSRATVMVRRANGRTRWVRVPLDRRGDASFTVPFDRRRIQSVALTLTNASTRIAHCNSGTLWSCAGRPLDDGPGHQGLRFTFNARAVR